MRTFFERVIIASLPLVIAPGCGGDKPTGPGNGGSHADLSTGVGGGGGTGGSGGSDGSSGIVDMAGGGVTNDLFGYVPPDMVDVCEYQHPPVTVAFPPSAVPDAGLFLVDGNPTLSISCVAGDTTCVCNQYCTTGYTICISPHTRNVDMGAWEVACTWSCGILGRRPAGLEAPLAHASCTVGQYFAVAAHLEAASVHSFRVMARELTAHGAPARLVADARRALADEVRHARLTRKFALAHHAKPAPVKVAPQTPRSLEAIAVENAGEGCVRETYAALVAAWQARAAGDPAVRELMAGIAVDETRHAQLAWDVDSWVKTKLDRAARARVKTARLQTAADLATEMSVPPAPELVSSVGLPDVDRAREFVAAAKRELWS